MSITLSPPRTASWAPLPVLLAGTFMIVLDFFIVNVALPAVQTDLGASAGALEWVVAGYGLTFAVLLITAGRLAARLVQSATAALMSPQVLSIMGTLYAGEQRVRAMAVYGLSMGLAAAGGQLIGGALIEGGLRWRGCFLINVPIGLAALAAVRRCVPESKAETASRLDVTGTVLITLGLTDVVLPLVVGREHGWPAWTWLCLAAAPVTLGLFAVHQRRVEHPLVPPALFADRAVRAGLLIQTHRRRVRHRRRHHRRRAVHRVLLPGRRGHRRLPARAVARGGRRRRTARASPAAAPPRRWSRAGR